MYLKSLELVNLRSFKRAKIELGKGINVLIGRNNSGKSTIIKSIYKLQNENAIQKEDIRSNENYSKIFLELSEINERDQLLFFNKDNPTVFPDSSNQKMVFALSGLQAVVDERIYFNANHIENRLEYDRVEILNPDNGEKVDFKILPTFPDKEDSNNFIYPFLAKRKLYGYETKTGIEETNKVTDDFRHLASKIQRIGNSSHIKNKEFVSLCQDILGFNIGIIPGENGYSHIGLFTNMNRTISVQSMGDGVINILGLIVILLTENNKLFLIEELENDIHPEALKKLLDLIISKSKQNQFIVSTHSNIVLQYLGSLPDTRIFYTESFMDETTYENVKLPTSTIIQLENTPEVRIKILKELGYELNDFDLYEAYLLLEESSAEQIIRDFLIPNFIPSLYGKIKTISAKGVDDLVTRTIDFERLFVFIHTNSIYFKKAWIIADGDDAGLNCIKKLKETFSKWPANHFLNWPKSNFEYYYPDRFQEKVTETFKIADKAKRKNAKTDLLKEVANWSINNRELAKNEFETSAKEVIDMLKAINKQLK